MLESHRILRTRNQNLKKMYFDNMKYTFILDILDKLDYVKDVPQHLQTFLQKQQYLHAVILLQVRTRR